MLTPWRAIRGQTQWLQPHVNGKLVRPASTSSTRKIVFSGIQPTGIPHVRCAVISSFLHLSWAQIGNYLGALQNWVKMQRDAHPEDRLIFSVVGWHALTLPQEPRKLAEARNEMLATLLAIGLDHKRSIIFHQDEVCHFTLFLVISDKQRFRIRTMSS